MCPIEPLESRIAPAGISIAHLAAGALDITSTDGDDVVYLHSDEPGYLSIACPTGDVTLDGFTGPTQAVTIPMPKGLISVKLLGGSDQLYVGSFSDFSPDALNIGTIVFPSSLKISDVSGGALVVLNGVVVKGDLTLNGGSGDDDFILESRVSVGKNFSAELGSGTSDFIRNRYSGLDFSVKGNFSVHGSAANTVVALGLTSGGLPVRQVDTDPNTPEELDVPLVLRDFRVGGSVAVEGGGSLARLMIGSAQISILGTATVKTTATGAESGLNLLAGGPLGIGKGLRVQTGGSSFADLEGQRVSIGVGVDVLGASGADEFSIYSPGSVRLPRVTLAYGDGDTMTRISAQDPWGVAGALTVTAGLGTDTVRLSGPGKLASTLMGSFGAGQAGVTMGSSGSGALSLGPSTKLTATGDLVVFAFNTILPGRFEVTGADGNDELAFDSVRATGAIIFNGNNGTDGLYIDDSASRLYTPSSFAGAVTANFGDGADTAVIGNDSGTGRAVFTGAVTFRGLLGESYVDYTTSGPTGNPYVKFKKAPVFL